MVDQTSAGKAFEYACLKALETSLEGDQSIFVSDDASYQKAKECFESLSPTSKARYMKAAYAAAEILYSSSFKIPVLRDALRAV
ncbi:MAG: HaeIII family restriction endonuclease, partial [Planctomycetia bacterium]|nr:HaeIII family restriction endonuclease [Planctomycetia bacterium]